MVRPQRAGKMAFDTKGISVLPQSWDQSRYDRRGLLVTIKGTKEEISIERHRFEGLILYEVTSDEVDQLERETLSISEDLTFATIGATAAISFLIALLTTDFKSERTFNVFFIVFLLMVALAIYCGAKWYRGRKSFSGVITRIKKRLGPFGEEGKEISPTGPGAPQESRVGGDQ